MATREDIEEWLARAALGDRRAFRPLYEATSAKLFGLCLHLLRDRAEAEDAFDTFIEAYNAKYPKAVEYLTKDREELLTFYDFPAEHWRHLRTTNPIESIFATIRLRTAKTRCCLSRNTALTMVFKLPLCAQSRWRRLNGSELPTDVVGGVRLEDGVRSTTQQAQIQDAA